MIQFLSDDIFILQISRKTYFTLWMTWKQKNYFRNGFRAPINIHIVILHVDIVLIEQKISHYLFQITGFGGHIGFCAYWPPGGYPNLYAVVFENFMPIPYQISKTCHQVRNFSEFPPRYRMNARTRSYTRTQHTFARTQPKCAICMKIWTFPHCY